MAKNKKKFLRGKISIKAEGNKITVVASDETLDRHGDVLSIDQWDLSKFKGSPRMLVDHDHQVEKIVGKWENIRIEGKQLLMDANFHEFTELAKAVKQMVEEGYLDTVSVGFIYNGPDRDGGKASFELIETSWVTVPANPNARVQASLKALLEKGISEDEKAKIKDFAGDESEVEESDDVLPEDDDDQDLDDEEDLDGEGDDEDDDEDEDEEQELSFDSVEDFKKAESTLGDATHVKISVAVLKKLIADSEQLSTLTDESLEVLRAKKITDLVSASMKEAAGMISHALRDVNRSAKN